MKISITVAKLVFNPSKTCFLPKLHSLYYGLIAFVGKTETVIKTEILAAISAETAFGPSLRAFKGELETEYNT